MTTDLILGTAGHIDHGKTSLIAALTGVNTDRLPEEKQRGITIDLGFAELLLDSYRLGIVDVPGHERFVRNMLAGATGLDLAMLVVAADDSIKPQTREHLDILRLLNLRAGVIAITKCDLVDPEWLELVEEEVRGLVETTFLESATLVRTSATAGTGIEELRVALAGAAAVAAQARHENTIPAPFRLAIDRTFTMPGHGTVVTGSVSSGQTRLGDELTIEPGGITVRVRGLQNHDRIVDEVHRGQRAAINLAGVHHQQIQRGQELATPGHLQASRLLSVLLSVSPSAPRPLKNRSRVRLHVGTAQLLSRVLLLGADKLSAGQTAPAQLLLSSPAVTTWNQPFVIRSESPVQTIGGGQVLVPNADRVRATDTRSRELLDQLRSPQPLARAAAALYFAGLRGWQPDDLARTAGIEAVHDIADQLRSTGVLLEIPISPTRTLNVHREVVAQLGERIQRALKSLHRQQPLRLSIDRQVLRRVFDYVPDAVFDTALNQLVESGSVHTTPQTVAAAGSGPSLSQNEQKLLGQLIELYRRAGIQSPGVKEVQQQVTRNQQSVPQLIVLATANGDLIEIAPDYYLHADVNRQLQAQLRPHLAGQDGLTLSQIREILGTTRKYAVPYCEYLDRTGFTRRQDDLRFLGRTAPA